MRRKKDDKRVLRPGNGQQKKSKRRLRRNNARKFKQPKRPPINNNRRNRPKRKANKSFVLIMIIALVAFVIGAGIGISFCLDDGSDDGPHYENVTKEMTTNLNQTVDPNAFDEDVDRVDYNENVTALTEDMEVETTIEN